MKPLATEEEIIAQYDERKHQERAEMLRTVEERAAARSLIANLILEANKNGHRIENSYLQDNFARCNIEVKSLEPFKDFMQNPYAVLAARAFPGFSSNGNGEYTFRSIERYFVFYLRLCVK